MYHCVGCGANTPWDRESLFSYTCPCGGHIFAENATGELVLPESLGMVLMDRVLHDKRALPPPHLNYLLGESEHTSTEKAKVLVVLRAMGAIWMCEREPGPRLPEGKDRRTLDGD